jgi:hypothetical protein
VIFINWSNISIEEADIQYNINDKPMLYSCYWCGNGAYKTITRTSKLTGNTYTDFICNYCIDEKWMTGNR